MKHLKLTALAILLVAQIGCNKENEPEPVTPTWRAPSFDEANLYYYGGGVSFEQSSASQLCRLKSARIEIFGNFARKSEYNSTWNSFAHGLTAFSTTPGRSNVTLPCKAVGTNVSLQKRQVTYDADGNPVYQWVPAINNLSIGHVDDACNITLDPTIDVTSADKRIMVNVTHWPNNSPGLSGFPVMFIVCP